jgi:hypothetical protein
MYGAASDWRQLRPTAIMNHPSAAVPGVTMAMVMCEQVRSLRLHAGFVSLNQRGGIHQQSVQGLSELTLLWMYGAASDWRQLRPTAIS